MTFRRSIPLKFEALLNRLGRILTVLSTPFRYNSDMVRLGIDQLVDSAQVLKDKKVGILTNRSGVTSRLERNIDALLKAGVRLDLIFSPEHGLYASFMDGEKVREDSDRGTGIPIVPTYPHIEDALTRTAELDIVVFDIQDVGARFYTYISTLKRFVEAIPKFDFELWVADRPNPIGHFVEGWLPEPRFFSFVCAANLPVRHGLTVGEIALFYADELGVRDMVKVVPMDGWERDRMFWDTEMVWVPPSPAIPTPQTALVYCGTGFFEGTNISEGRGTARPFHLIGAPWIDGFKLSDTLNGLRLDAVRFLPAVFKPSASKYKDEVCQGVEIFVMDPYRYRAVEVGLRILSTIKELWPERFQWRKFNDSFFIDKLAGTDRLRTALDDGRLDEFFESNWVSDDYAAMIEEFLLYR